MTDNENLENGEDKKPQNNYERQREKFQGKIDELNTQLESEKAGRIADKISFFKSTLTSQWFKGNFDEFAGKYADKLSLDEMVALYKGTNWVATATTQTTAPESNEQEQKLGPQSVIQGTNPETRMWGKSFEEMSLEELKERGRQNPQIFNQG